MLKLIIGGLIVLVPASTLYAQSNPAVPDWIVKYANIQDAELRQCKMGLAQEQDKVDKITKELADAKAAAAAVKPAKEEKK